LRTILHISDVHFGPPHLPRVAEGVHELAASARPDLVVVSGDLTQRAKPAQFREARAFVDRFAAPTLVVPGNHDVPMYRAWERLLSPFGAYRRHFSRELEPVFRDEELLVVGVNTAFQWTIDHGRVTRRHLREAAERFRREDEGRVRVLVAHHHFIPPPRFERQRVMHNAYKAIEVFSGVGVDLILSGHKHQSYIANSEEFYPMGRPPVVIVHSGTTTSSRGRGAEKAKNTCNWVRVDGESISISHLLWEPALERFTEHSRHWFPRQERRPYNLEGLVPPAGIPTNG
jgi:3',5'-cyclic AMP phosphodiesterase CpdA